MVQLELYENPRRGNDDPAQDYLGRLLLELDTPWWRTFPVALRDALFPRKLPPLALTSKPANVQALELDVPLWRSLLQGLRGLFSAQPAPLQLTSRPIKVRELRVDQPLWRSLPENIHDLLFPPKLPPLRLESKPARVREIWGDYDYRKSGWAGTLLVHATVGVAIVAFYMGGGKVVEARRPVVAVMVPARVSNCS